MNIKTHAIRGNYRVQDEAEVFAFLDQHPILIDVLTQGYPQIERFFGQQTDVELEVTVDPETEADESGELFAYVRTALPVEEARAKLEAFDEAWFLDVLDRVDGNLSFNLRFV